MRIIRWAAVAVTVLFVLFNLGAAFDAQQENWIQSLGALLAASGAVAATGLATRQPWGRPAVIAVGALNVAAAIAALVADESGGAVGIALGTLAVVLGTLPADQAHQGEQIDAHA